MDRQHAITVCRTYPAHTAACHVRLPLLLRAEVTLLAAAAPTVWLPATWTSMSTPAKPLLQPAT